MDFSTRDEAVRDLKKALLKAKDDKAVSFAPTRAESWAPRRDREDVLHPEIGRLRDLAEPGGFRRAHLKTEGEQISVYYSSAKHQSLLTTLLDPRHRMGLLDVDWNSGLSEQSLQSMGDVEVRAGASDFATVLIILKSMIGGTLLILPGGFKSAGMLPAGALILVMGSTEILCMVRLIECSQAIGGGSFSDVARASFGKAAAVVVDVSLTLSQLGFVCAELLYFAKNGNAAFNLIGWSNAPSVSDILLYQLVFLIPMSFVRRLENFTITNFLASVSVLSCVVALAIAALARLSDEGSSPIEMWTPQWPLFAGTAVFSFEVINFVIPMYEAHNNKHNFVNILVTTLGTLMIFFIAWGCLNYFTYGEDTQDVLTLNLPKGSALGLIVPVAFAFASFCTAPLLLFPGTVVVESYCVSSGSDEKMRQWKKNAVRVFLSVLCTLIAAVGADYVELFISVLGSLTCVPLAFIYPSLFHLRMCETTTFSKLTDMLILFAGVVVFVVTGKQSSEAFLNTFS
jgi:proton-coupled amino acid transporter